MTRFRRLRRSRSCARFSKTRRVDSPPEGFDLLIDLERINKISSHYSQWNRNKADKEVDKESEDAEEEK
ncbi:hypothetical protein F2Q69_00055566 [Brassica cretica]|uniref:Uncharacterized protein n=1 Tax=Brassica cretica TaxID=69181 RepID=A0A8S9N8E6_BRACR|nr:hypothetical protein F2Q69_00055566 [Brassica cretica]